MEQYRVLIEVFQHASIAVPLKSSGKLKFFVAFNQTVLVQTKKIIYSMAMYTTYGTGDTSYGIRGHFTKQFKITLTGKLSL